MFHTFLTFVSSLQQRFPAADTAGFLANGTENAAPYGTALSVVCVLLGEREKNHIRIGFLLDESILPYIFFGILNWS